MLGQYLLQHLLFLCCLVLAVVTVQGNPTLQCNPTSIYVTITESFFARNSIDITDEGQLHFNEHPECSAERTADGYVLSTYTPYTDCGTRVEHRDGKYIFRNEVVFSSPQSYQAIMSMECQYDDKYVVSSPFGTVAHIRSLNFATVQGTVRIGMNLYQRSDFHPKSKYGSRPSIVVGVPVYVSVDMDDIFGDERIVTSLKSCYATTSSAFEVMNSYHFLITGRCASPGDRTVRIFSNGESTKARFSFQMFQWKNSKEEYIYLHCEIYICNRTSEICSGTGPLCHNNGDASSVRRKRDVGPSGFLTMGPIAMATIKGVGEPSIHTDLKVIKQDQELLTYCIFGGVFGLLFLITIVLVIATIARRRRLRNKKILNSDSGTSLESVTDIPQNLPQT